MAKKTNATVTVTPKARGGKSGQTRERRAFWGRALQAPKVSAALTELGVDLSAFEKAYNATRKTREAREFTEAEVTAIKNYREHKDFDKLAAELDVSPITAMFRVKVAIEKGMITLA